MSSFNRDTVRKLDCCGLVQRVHKREQGKQVPQQIGATSPEAHRRGFDGHLAAMRRQYDVEKLKELQERDPLLFFFRFANSSIETA